MLDSPHPVVLILHGSYRQQYFPSLFIAEHSYEIETLFSFYRLYKEKIKTEGQFRWKNRDIQ